MMVLFIFNIITIDGKFGVCVGGGGGQTYKRLEYHKISKNWDIQITVIVLKMEKSFDFTMS